MKARYRTFAGSHRQTAGDPTSHAQISYSPRLMPSPLPKNAFYAQSGGVTAVINASACGLIETARRYPARIGKVYAGRHGILGALTEDLIDTTKESRATIAGLRHTPGGAFGSARYKLAGLDKNRAQYERLIEVFRAHDIGYFFYNGGNDSMDTAHKVSEIGALLDYPITSIGVPKTVDNDLPVTDCCPGFGSAAKYIAVSTREAALDVHSMARTSTRVFVLEVMGRHAGWLAAASGLAADASPGAAAGSAPHVILFPAFGHAQLGGVGPVVAQMTQEAFGYKFHWAVADYLQRSARHIASKVDVDQAYAVGKAAVMLALQGRNAVMPVIVRKSAKPYRWTVGHAPLAAVANKEKKVPRSFITADGFGITAACRQYLSPLIHGEDYPPYKSGVPAYVSLKGIPVAKRLKTRFEV
jgi:6-phosphofructokinase